MLVATLPTPLHGAIFLPCFARWIVFSLQKSVEVDGLLARQGTGSGGWKYSTAGRVCERHGCASDGGLPGLLPMPSQLKYRFVVVPLNDQPKQKQSEYDPKKSHYPCSKETFYFNTLLLSSVQKIWEHFSVCTFYTPTYQLIARKIWEPEYFLQVPVLELVDSIWNCIFLHY